MNKGIFLAGLMCLWVHPAASASVEERVAQCTSPEKPELVCLVDAAPAHWRAAILADARMLRNEAGLGYKASRSDDDSVLIPAIFNLIAFESSRTLPKQSLEDRRWREIVSISSRSLIESARSLYLVQVKNEALQEKLSEIATKELLLTAASRHMEMARLETLSVQKALYTALTKRALDDIGMHCSSATKCLQSVSKVTELSSPLWGGTPATMMDHLRLIAKNDLVRLMEFESP